MHFCCCAKCPRVEVPKGVLPPQLPSLGTSCLFFFLPGNCTVPTVALQDSPQQDTTRACARVATNAYCYMLYWYLWSWLDVYTPLSSFHAAQQVLAQRSSRAVALIHLSFVLPGCATSAGSKELARGSSNSLVFCPAPILSHS